MGHEPRGGAGGGGGRRRRSEKDPSPFPVQIVSTTVTCRECLWDEGRSRRKGIVGKEPWALCLDLNPGHPVFPWGRPVRLAGSRRWERKE